MLFFMSTVIIRNGPVRNLSIRLKRCSAYSLLSQPDPAAMINKVKHCTFRNYWHNWTGWTNLHRSILVRYSYTIRHKFFKSIWIYLRCFFWFSSWNQNNKIGPCSMLFMKYKKVATTHAWKIAKLSDCWADPAVDPFRLLKRPHLTD